MKKKLGIILLVILLISTSVLLVACGDSTDNKSKNENEQYTRGLEYQLNDDKTYAVKSYGTATDIKVKVPKKHNSVDVTKIISLQSPNIEEVVLPETIKYIEKEAFLNNGNMNKINIPSSVEEIGQNAFLNSMDNKFINGLKYIDNWLVERNEDFFMSFVNLNEGTVGIANNFTSNKYFAGALILPDSLKYIGEKAFYECNLKFVFAPKNVEYGNNAFSYIIKPYEDNLIFTTEDFSVNEKINNISNILTATEFNREKICFDNNFLYYLDNDKANLLVSLNLDRDDTTISIPDIIFKDNIKYKVEEISHSAFKNFKNLISIKLPKYLKKIGKEAFKGCCLESIKIPRGTEEIGDYAFDKNEYFVGYVTKATSLMEVYLPNSVTIIGKNAIQINGKGNVYTDLNQKPVNFQNDWLITRACYVKYLAEPIWNSELDY